MFWWNEDLWTCPSNGKKFLGVRVYRGNALLERKSALLAAWVWSWCLCRRRQRRGYSTQRRDVWGWFNLERNAGTLFFYSVPLSVYVSNAVPLSLHIVCVSVWMVLCVIRVGCTDESHDQLRPRRWSCVWVRHAQHTGKDTNGFVRNTCWMYRWFPWSTATPTRIVRKSPARRSAHSTTRATIWPKPPSWNWVEIRE